MVEEQLLSRLAALLPHLDEPELRFRHAATLAAIGSLRSGRLQPLWSEPDDQSRLIELVVTWISGGLRAPAAVSLRT